MYAMDGAFGKVRLLREPIGIPQIEVPFHITHAGWHCCNDQYHIQREIGTDSHLLLFNINDGGRMELNGKAAVCLPASSVAWIPPRCKQAYYAGRGEQWEFYWIHIQEDPCLQLDSVFGDEFWMPIRHMNPIVREFERVLQRKQMTPDEFQVECSGMISMFYHILLQEKCQQQENGATRDQLVHEIISSMEADCSYDWNLPELARQYYISVPQLIRRFKAETGMPPYAYLIKIRLQLAEIYLKSSNLSVEAIAGKVGFSGTSNFIAQFQKYYGTTPQRYR